MLKLVPPRPRAPRRKTRAPVKKEASVRALYTRIEQDRQAGQSTQRAVARARHKVIDTQCGVRRAASRAARLAGNPLPAPVLADIVARLEDIHQRLLLFSTSIELEIDRLDMVQAEIEHLTTHPQAGNTR